MWLTLIIIIITSDNHFLNILAVPSSAELRVDDCSHLAKVLLHILIVPAASLRLFFVIIYINGIDIFMYVHYLRGNIVIYMLTILCG